MRFNAIQTKDKKSLTDRIADNISQMIIEKNLISGDKLPNEFDLAASLNVGRGTIREAIKILISQNILEVKRGKGTFVVSKPGFINDPWGFKFVDDKYKLAFDLLEARILFEPKIAELAAERASDEELNTLDELCKAVEALILEGKPHINKDIEFHEWIAKCTKNAIFTNLIPIITYGIDISIELTKNTLVKETIETHRAITNAIMSRNTHKASLAMEQHLIYNRDRLIKFKKELSK